MNRIRMAMFVLLIGCTVGGRGAEAVAPASPLRVLLAGLAHGHTNSFLREADPDVVTLVGAWEREDSVWEKYRPRLGGVRRFTDLDAAIAQSGAEAVWAFSDTRDHLEIVRAAAPAKLPVIVEKPLAVSWAAAAEMAALAERHGTLVLTNYETSWYPVFEEVRQMLRPDGPLGPLRQIYAYAGHEGPVKIRVGPEFLEWLRDPARAGGGALFDFGCYGANLATWWLGNRAPISVSAHTWRFDPVNYPECDDHSVIDLIYADMHVKVIGSWHWPFNRKDVTLYGETGTVVTTGNRTYTFRPGRGRLEQRESSVEPRVPLAWLAHTIRAGRDPIEDPSSLANNLVVMRILEAARRSAAEGRTVPLAEIGDR